MRPTSRARLRPAVVLLGATALLVAAVLLSLAVGSATLPLSGVLRALHAPDGSQTSVVVRDLRVPRTLVGLVAGAALGVAGPQLQGLTRNPLADPALLGVSAGAALAVVTGSVLGVGGALGRPVAALAGALAATALVFALAGRGRGGAGTVHLVLAGVALSALLSSATSVLVLLDASTLDSYRFWVVGSLAGRSAVLLVPVLPFLAAGAVLAAVCARGLDLLALGEDVARGLGAHVGRQRAGTVLSSALLTASAVAVAGPLTFVGLLVPHLARPLVGPVHRRLLPLCALLGAAVVLLSDVLARVVARPAEVQVGIVTALLGAPVLVAVVRRRTPAAAA